MRSAVSAANAEVLRVRRTLGWQTLCRDTVPTRNLLLQAWPTAEGRPVLPMFAPAAQAVAEA